MAGAASARGARPQDDWRPWHSNPAADSGTAASSRGKSARQAARFRRKHRRVDLARLTPGSTATPDSARSTAARHRPQPALPGSARHPGHAKASRPCVPPAGHQAEKRQRQRTPGSAQGSAPAGRNCAGDSRRRPRTLPAANRRRRRTKMLPAPKSFCLRTCSPPRRLPRRRRQSPTRRARGKARCAAARRKAGCRCPPQSRTPSPDTPAKGSSLSPRRKRCGRGRSDDHPE